MQSHTPNNAYSSPTPRTVDGALEGTQRGKTWFLVLEPAPRVVDSIPKRRKISEQVTKMEMTIRTITTYVNPIIGMSAT